MHAQEDAEEAATLRALHALDARYRALLMPPGAHEAVPLPPRPPPGAVMAPAPAAGQDGCFELVRLGLAACMPALA